METISIRNPGMYWDIAATIHFPPDFDAGKRYPVVVSNHPIGSCKEQTSGNVYGAALAKAGFVMREGFSNFDPVGALEGMATQRTGENGGADERINILLPASVEEGKAAGITDIDVLEATDYYRNRCPAKGTFRSELAPGIGRVGADSTRENRYPASGQ